MNLIEPEWPEGHEQVWGGWSPTRGKIIPGTAILVCRRTATVVQKSVSQPGRLSEATPAA